MLQKDLKIISKFITKKNYSKTIKIFVFVWNFLMIIKKTILNVLYLLFVTVCVINYVDESKLNNRGNARHVIISLMKHWSAEVSVCLEHLGHFGGDAGQSNTPNCGHLNHNFQIYRISYVRSIYGSRFRTLF